MIEIIQTQISIHIFCEYKLVGTFTLNAPLPLLLITEECLEYRAKFLYMDPPAIVPLNTNYQIPDNPDSNVDKVRSILSVGALPDGGSLRKIDVFVSAKIPQKLVDSEWGANLTNHGFSYKDQITGE